MKVKKSSLLILVTLLSFFSGKAQDFITKWTFPSSATSITFNALTAGGAVNYTWAASPSGNNGSGSFTRTTAGSVTVSGLTIPAGNVVTLTMQPTNLRRFYINSGTDKTKLTDVSQWGGVPWSSMASAFNGCYNVDISATDIPDLSAVTDMSNMFTDCYKLTGPSNIDSWNTSAVENMSGLFSRAKMFNQPIGDWNTSNVTNMNLMFNGMDVFNQPIGNWNTSSVEDMGSMFYNTVAFNQPIGNWNTSSVKIMTGMFGSAVAFNQPIDSWNTGSVTHMNSMFYDEDAFNQPLGNWNTAAVKDMSNMFEGTHLFNQPINTWNTSSLTNATAMFYFTDAFNQPLSNWNTANVSGMSYMFGAAASFNQDIGMWTLKADVLLNNMFTDCGMNVCNYSATLRGWANNNSTVTGRTLGSFNMKYTSLVANAERNTLVNSRGWNIQNDQPYTPYVFLMPEANTVTAMATCEDNIYVDPVYTYNKILSVNANGNSFNYSAATVTVTNEFISTPPAGVATVDQGLGLGGFYEMNSGSNTLRVSRRLHSIQQPGNYTTNGGVIVRVYYDPAEITTIKDNSTLPSESGSLITSGWFKSSKHNAADVVNDMTPLTLSNAHQVTPVSAGQENGVDYVEFLLPNFSTIGYYAYTQPIILPVKLAYFTGSADGCAASLQWKTAVEENFSHFEIERSEDDNNYSKIAAVNTSGSAEGNVYMYKDKTAVTGRRYYYRLKMIDNDGRYSYSKMIRLSVDCNKSPVLAAYPNPASDYVTLQLPAAGGILNVYATDGKLMLSRKEGNAISVVDVSHFSRGVYMVRYATDKEVKVIKLIKK